MQALPLLLFSFDFHLSIIDCKMWQFRKSANGRTPTMHESSQFARFQLRLQLLIMCNWFILAGLSMSYNFTIFLCAPSKQKSSKHFRLPFFFLFYSIVWSWRMFWREKWIPMLGFIWELIYQLNTSFVDKYFWDRYRNNCNNYKFWDCLPCFWKDFQGNSRHQTSQCMKKCCDGNDKSRFDWFPRDCWEMNFNSN